MAEATWDEMRDYMRTQGVTLYAQFMGSIIGLDSEAARRLYIETRARETEA